MWDSTPQSAPLARASHGKATLQVGGGFPLERILEMEHRLDGNLVRYEKDRKKRQSLPTISFMKLEPEVPDAVVLDLDKTVVCARNTHKKNDWIFRIRMDEKPHHSCGSHCVVSCLRAAASLFVLDAGVDSQVWRDNTQRPMAGAYFFVVLASISLDCKRQTRTDTLDPIQLPCASRTNSLGQHFGICRMMLAC